MAQAIASVIRLFWIFAPLEIAEIPVPDVLDAAGAEIVFPLNTEPTQYVAPFGLYSSIATRP
jgi:hypothetical protein